MDATDYAVVQIAPLDSLRELVLTRLCLSTSSPRLAPLVFSARGGHARLGDAMTRRKLE